MTQKLVSWDRLNSFIFLRKDFARTKSTKSTKSLKTQPSKSKKRK